jgi:putative hemolysin
MIGLAAAALAGLLLVSAVLTAGEVAAFQIGASRLRTLGEEGFRGAGALAEVRSKEPAVRASVRLATRVLNLAAVALAAVTQASSGGLMGPWLSALLGILLVLVVADLMPHLLASRHPVRLGLSLAPTLLAVLRSTRLLTGPLALLEERFTNGGGEVLSVEHRELREMQEIGNEEGVLEASENLLVERAFRLDELTAWDVMVPRVDIFAWKEDLTLGDIVDGLAEVPYSRVPVYRQSVDDVTGIVYVREAYERYARGDRTTALRELAREPFFVPGSLSLAQLLQDFQSRRIHMGIVADEFGGTDGLVTLEDVLEELVGEIHDETDVHEEEVVRLSDSVLECDAGVDIRDLNEALQVSLPQVEHRSLNGFILEELGEVPEAGESLSRDGVKIEILESTETQVLRARLTRLADELQNAE